MFQRSAPKSKLHSAASLLELIYHSTVRHIRKSHGNAVIGLFLNIIQSLVLVIVFYFMFSVLGLRGSAVRGDFILYIMSGIFLFMTHIKAIGAVAGAEGPTSPMMHHLPMNTIVAITSAALGTLYIQVLAMGVILFMYDVLASPITVYKPAAAFSMLLLSWFSGCAIGMLFLALKPWFPSAVAIVSQLYTRANMITSGKMFLANTMPGYFIAMFSWNPLFHTIDQARGFTFINYNPHYSSVSYPIYFSLACLVIGLMGEFFTRQRASISWFARR
ncbi:ABC transporter permease [Plastorhodobacter daqingensis]|uniref:ABC transporter permease n=1 Tax=Plastorhodobacter daqingensis TaxID=1387281 RepID=A0ABW2UDH3_9RHOB